MNLCANCGVIDEDENLVPVTLKGEDAVVCLRCMAEFQKLIKKYGLEQAEPTKPSA